MKRIISICIVLLLVSRVAFATIAQRGTATTAAVTNNASLTINAPAGLQAGDLMIANLVQVNSLTPPTAPTGWTLIDHENLNGVTNRYASVFYKVAGSSEGSSYTFTVPTGGSVTAIGAIVAFSGVNSTTPFDVTPGSIQVNASGNDTAPGKTTVTANDAIVMLGQAAGSAPTWSNWTTTSPGALTAILNYQGTETSIGAAWALKATAGATGNGTATLSPGERNGGILLALKPAAGLTIAKTFSPTSILPGGTSLLTLTITNPNSTAITGAGVTDNFPTGMTEADSNASTNCTSGSLTPTPAPGNASITLAGATVSANGSCTVTVNVTAST